MSELHSYHVVTKDGQATRIAGVMALEVDPERILWMHDANGRPVFFASMSEVVYVKDLGSDTKKAEDLKVHLSGATINPGAIAADIAAKIR